MPNPIEQARPSCSVIAPYLVFFTLISLNFPFAFLSHEKNNTPACLGRSLCFRLQGLGPFYKPDSMCLSLFSIHLYSKWPCLPLFCPYDSTCCSSSFLLSHLPLNPRTATDLHPLSFLLPFRLTNLLKWFFLPNELLFFNLTASTFLDGLVLCLCLLHAVSNS